MIFLKGDQLDFLKTGHIIFLIRLDGATLQGFHIWIYIEKQIWKNGLPGGISTKIGHILKKIKNRVNFIFLKLERLYFFRKEQFYLFFM
jgi:hypothetical protein